MSQAETSISYSMWNDRLLRYFFGPAASHEHIRLTVTNDLLDSEFDDLGGFESFRTVLFQGPEWPILSNGEWWYNDSFANTCLGLYRQWRGQDPRHDLYKDQYDKFDGPPYFYYLCALCLAWTQETDEFRDSNFYSRLELIYPDHSLKQTMGRLSHLWDGLEKWTQLHSGELGWFNVECLGNHAHVGLPKSQVILTPGKIEKIAGLFYDLALSPDEPMDQEKLKSKIISEFDGIDFLLGKHIFNEIAKSTDLGKSALTQLLDYFEVWDGLPPVRFRGGSSAVFSPTNGAVDQASLIAGLQFLPDVKSWMPVRMARVAEIPNGQLELEVDGRIYSSAVRNGVSSGFTCESEDSDIKDLLFADVQDDPYVCIKWKNEFEGERDIVAVIEPPAPIVSFAWTSNGQFLFQLPALPTEGQVYVLVRKDVDERFKNWCEAYGVQYSVDIPQQGLGADERLYHLDKIGSAKPEDWSTFPDGGDGRRKGPRRMTLVGGSRQRREKPRRTYLPFDPPSLKLEAEGDVSLVSENCVLDEINSELQLPSWVKPNHSTRLFEITPEVGTSRVSITR